MDQTTSSTGMLQRLRSDPDVTGSIEMNGASLPSLNDSGATCRICFGDASEGRLFSPCKCKGTMGHVHVECLQKWRIEKENSPSYYRCDQCHYNYNLKRVDAAGILKHPCFIQFISILILFSICTLVSMICYSLFPQYEIIKHSPKVNSALQGLIIVGVFSFMLSILRPECRRSRSMGCNGVSCNHCPAGGIPFEAGAGEFIFFIFIIALIYIAIVGVARAMIFTYDLIYGFAREGAEILETTVLDISETQDSHLQDLQYAQMQVV